MVPACSLACLYAGNMGADETAQPEKPGGGKPHKFEIEFEMKTSVLKRTTEQNRNYIEFIKTLQSERVTNGRKRRSGS